ncbi:MAG: hypothetical protein DHS80DRAFT_25355 [Piptocephalis tieghemiana]|nr:MAG: hypothetical protein DHS80DRAFT_25355 [Piptocephalis tieghemiana]
MDEDPFVSVCLASSSQAPAFISFRLSSFLYCLAVIWASYIIYYVIACYLQWEHKEKTLADHYTDMVQAAAYILILFTFGDYSRTAGWITGVAYASGLLIYGLLVEVPFLRVSLPGFRGWSWATHTFMAGATLLILAGAGYHFYLAAHTGILWPWYVVGLIVGLLIPSIGAVLVALDYRQRQGLRRRLLQTHLGPPSGSGSSPSSPQSSSSSSSFSSSASSSYSSPSYSSPSGSSMPAHQDESATMVPTGGGEEGEGVPSLALKGLPDPPFHPPTIEIPQGSKDDLKGQKARSNLSLRTQRDVDTYLPLSSSQERSSPSSPHGSFSSPTKLPRETVQERMKQNEEAEGEERDGGSHVGLNSVPDARDEERSERRGRGRQNKTLHPSSSSLHSPRHLVPSTPPPQSSAALPSVIDGTASMLLGFRVHLHHWQIFYLFAFFTRFPEPASQVCAGLVIAFFMQGGIAYGFDPMMEPIYHYRARGCPT